MVQIRRFALADKQAIKKLVSEIMDREFQADKEAFSAEDLENLEKHYGNFGEAFFVIACRGSILWR